MVAGLGGTLVHATAVATTPLGPARAPQRESPPAPYPEGHDK